MQFRKLALGALTAGAIAAGAFFATNEEARNGARDYFEENVV